MNRSSLRGTHSPPSNNCLLLGSAQPRLRRHTYINASVPGLVVGTPFGSHGLPASPAPPRVCTARYVPPRWDPRALPGRRQLTPTPLPGSPLASHCHRGCPPAAHLALPAPASGEKGTAPFCWVVARLRFSPGATLPYLVCRGTSILRSLVPPTLYK